MTIANVKIEPMKVLLDGTDVGCTDGDLSFTPTEESFELFCHQTGQQLLDKLRTAVNYEVSVVMKEVSTTQLNALFSYAGQTYTPADGVAVIGVGTKKLGSSMIADAKVLTLHPVNAPAAPNEYTRDHTWWKAYPTINNVTFSGETPVLVDVTFSVFRDESKVEEANIYVFGDTTSEDQDFDIPAP
jgi:hypothetical protein